MSKEVIVFESVFFDESEELAFFGAVACIAKIRNVDFGFRRVDAELFPLDGPPAVATFRALTSPNNVVLHGIDRLLNQTALAFAVRAGRVRVQVAVGHWVCVNYPNTITPLAVSRKPKPRPNTNTAEETPLDRGGS